MITESGLLCTVSEDTVNNGPGNDWFYIPDQEDQILFDSKYIFLLNIAEHPSSKMSETRTSVDFFSPPTLEYLFKL